MKFIVSIDDIKHAVNNNTYNCKHEHIDVGALRKINLHGEFRILSRKVVEHEKININI